MSNLEIRGSSENWGEIQYLNLVHKILHDGIESGDRTGVGTYSVFGEKLVFDLSKGFPLLTTKKINFKNIVTELLWFLRGDTNIKYLQDHECPIWNEWADENGNLGPVYGKQWRRWTNIVPNGAATMLDKPIDQIANMVETLKNNPNSRRNLVIAFNPAEIPEKAPPACHTMFQAYARNGELSLQLYQRSADLMIGVPYNIASYSLLLLMLAQISGLKPGKFHHVFGDVHIYKNHVKGAEKQLDRKAKDFPTVSLNENVTDLFSFTHEDVILKGYDPHGFIKFPIAV